MGYVLCLQEWFQQFGVQIGNCFWQPKHGQSVSNTSCFNSLWVFFLLPDSLPFWACLSHFLMSELMPEAQSSRISVSFRKYIKAILIVSKLSVFPSATPALAPNVMTLTPFSTVLQRMVCCCFLLTAVSRYH